MKTRLILAICISSIFGASTLGCSGKRTTTVFDHDAFEGTIVRLDDDCRHSSEVEAGALAALAPVLVAITEKVVDKSIELGASYLSKQADSYKASSSGRAASQFYQIDPDPTVAISVVNRCLTVVRGKFGPLRKDLDTTAVANWTPANLTHFGLAEPPEFYVEFGMVYVTDYSAFRLRPLELYYRGTAAKQVSRKERKDILIRFAFENPNKPGDEDSRTVFAVSEVAFPKVKIGSHFKGAGLKEISTPWMPLLAPTLEIKRGVYADKKPSGETILVGEDSLTRSAAPFSVLVTVEESENAGDLLRGASEALSKNKERLTEEALKLVKKNLGIDDETQKGEEKMDGGDEKE